MFGPFRITGNVMEARLKSAIFVSIASGALVAAFWAPAASAAEVYRWVDENGEVHYSESLPPDYKDSGFDVLNRQGIVTDEDQTLTPKPPPPKVPTKDEPQELPRDASGLPRPKALYSETEMQQRMDNFLMLRYESEQEIADAMNVEIKQLNYDRRLLEGSRASMNQAYRGQIRVAAERQRAGLPVEAATTHEIEKLRKSLATNSNSLAGLQQREDSIREDFDKQLNRYRYLIETWSEESPDS
jgi:hypothetical protein